MLCPWWELIATAADPASSAAAAREILVAFAGSSSLQPSTMSRDPRDRFACRVVACHAFAVRIPTKREDRTLTLKPRFLTECTPESQNRRAACKRDGLASNVRTAKPHSTCRVSRWRISDSKFDLGATPLRWRFPCQALDVPVVARNKPLPCGRGCWVWSPKDSPM